MRKERISIGEYYHVYNRGIKKNLLFHDERDYLRFLFLLLYFQSDSKFYNIGRYVSNHSKKLLFGVSSESIKSIIKKRSVELVSFCIMPNHFHVIVKEHKENGIALYMHRVIGGYARYYNLRYKTSGHLFQGAYKAVHIEDNTQLLYLSAYIHRNPRTLKEWHRAEDKYPWSSYQAYVTYNIFEELLVQNIILGQFKDTKDYERFLYSSPAKAFIDEFDSC